MPTFDLTSADVGTVIANTPGSMTRIEAIGRGTSGGFSLSDHHSEPWLFAADGSIGVDYPARVILANNNPQSAVQPIPQTNLLGEAVPFTALQVDEVPLCGASRLTTGVKGDAHDVPRATLKHLWRRPTR
jgi:hypothetical protein